MQYTYQCVSALCAEFLHRISLRPEVKCGKQEHKFIYNSKPNNLIFSLSCFHKIRNRSLSICGHLCAEVCPSWKKSAQNKPKFKIRIWGTYGFQCTHFHETHTCSKVLRNNLYRFSPKCMKKYERCDSHWAVCTNTAFDRQLFVQQSHVGSLGNATDSSVTNRSPKNGRTDLVSTKGGGSFLFVKDF